jgi:hypothetical protein
MTRLGIGADILQFLFAVASTRHAKMVISDQPKRLDWVEIARDTSFRTGSPTPREK